MVVLKKDYAHDAAKAIQKPSLTAKIVETMNENATLTTKLIGRNGSGKGGVRGAGIRSTKKQTKE